jgi:adenylate cyclase
MRQFDFTADGSRSRLREIDELLESVERAKTAARAMCKYIPLPLVRSLYTKNREPELGGEPREVTLLFSDIQGFTSLAERLEPSQLALRLGLYLEVTTRTLERHGATIDKYIGDAVMAFWNAPDPLEDHSARACRAVLDCRRALAELYASPAWGAEPPLVTRFGLHRGRVLVGHFGAPTRLSYTALGDGVNLAARLESECKRLGVTVLASASVVHTAGASFAFRALDRVTVRGKTEPVDVYELVGEAE